MTVRWPETLWIVRHGESAGNVAAAAAAASGTPHIAIEARDVDVPLSPRGEEQSAALGRWFGALSASERPEVVMVSPYLRARTTASLIASGLALGAPPVLDERLREREFGVLDRLTRHGVESLFPDQAKMLTTLGKFYYRPPGGESWCDVILRLRGALDTISLHYAGERVLIVAHQVVVLCLRYILCGLDEAEILAIDAEAELANCGVTQYRFDSGRPKLTMWNTVASVVGQSAQVTAERDAKIAAR